jgi:hypothetical protein
MWGSHWSILLEKRGLPGVYVVDEPFIEDVQVTLEKEGMPALRRVNVPHPCGEIEDKDIPKIMKELVKALTVPLNAEETKTGVIKPKKAARIAVTGTLAEVQNYFRKERWTDGLPIIPPTEEAVKEMLKGTSHKPDKIVVQKMLPEDWIVNVEQVAINAVMAGCKPEYMPVLLAMVEAFAVDQFSSAVRSTNSFSFMTVVNGPIRNEIEMNSGINALGSGTRNDANASIGRFLKLAVINLGGSDTSTNDMGSQGNPSKYAFAFAENEERSPWEPLHVSLGYKKGESTVSIFSGGWGHAGNICLPGDHPSVLDVAARYIADFELPLGVAVIIDPSVARALAKKGYSKDKVREELWNKATLTAKQFRESGVYPIFIEPVIKGRPIYGVKDIWPAWYLNAPDDKIVKTYGKKDFIYPIVVGGETNPMITSWKMHFPSTVSVDKWR